MKKLWFARKGYGWGWYPANWQGWLVILIYIAVLIYIFRKADVASYSGSDTLISFAPKFLLVTAILYFICWKTGEKLRWLRPWFFLLPYMFPIGNIYGKQHYIASREYEHKKNAQWAFFLCAGRGAENRTPSTRPPALCTAVILHPGFYFVFLARALMHLAQALTRLWEFNNLTHCKLG